MVGAATGRQVRGGGPGSGMFPPREEEGRRVFLPAARVSAWRLPPLSVRGRGLPVRVVRGFASPGVTRGRARRGPRRAPVFKRRVQPCRATRHSKHPHHQSTTARTAGAERREG